MEWRLEAKAETGGRFAGLEADEEQAGLRTEMEAGAGQDRRQRIQVITSSRLQGRTAKSRNGWKETDSAN